MARASQVRFTAGEALQGGKPQHNRRAPALPADVPPKETPTRAIALLALAGFASQAMVRATDSLLPQIAADIGVTVGAASIIVTLYAVTHGSVQLIIGPVGDRFGKFRSVAIACSLCALTVLACGLAQSLTALALARIAAALTAGWIIPLGMAFVGDAVPYERRQQVLGRYLTGQITGQLFGQAAGGIIGDLFGWRAVFFILAAVFTLTAVALFRELAINPTTRPQLGGEARSRGFAADYSIVLANPWARVLLFAAVVEAALMWGAFAYVGADLHLRFGLSFTLIGLIVAMFGIGGLTYAALVPRLVGRFGQTGLATLGGLLIGAAYLALALAPAWWIAPPSVVAVGLGFYMLHNTLQTNATQMSPQARGTAVALFSSALYVGQSAGVAAGSLLIDRAGGPAIFVIAALLLPVLGFWFAARLRRRSVT
ncbi:MAG TPA: MFS transporter [Xanthobacteraceae bacterium]|nr:MFS transporter [Xanthobacteraceae bacterium]